MTDRIPHVVSRPLTWLVAVGVLAIGLVAILDAVKASSSDPEAAPTNPFIAPAPAAASLERLPTCTTRQLELVIEIPGGSAAVALRHVSGSPCHLRRLPVKVWVRDRSGHLVRLVAGHVGEALTGTPFRGDFTPAFEQLRNITFLPRCTPETTPRGPFVLSARAGPYHAHRKISGKEIGCFGGG
jgi:hypothetical protein